MYADVLSPTSLSTKVLVPACSKLLRNDCESVSSVEQVVPVSTEKHFKSNSGTLSPGGVLLPILGVNQQTEPMAPVANKKGMEPVISDASSSHYSVKLIRLRLRSIIPECSVFRL